MGEIWSNTIIMYCVLMFRSSTRVTAYHVENLISAKNFGEGGKSCTSLDDDDET